MPRLDWESWALEPGAGMWSGGGKVSGRGDGAASDVLMTPAFPDQGYETVSGDRGGRWGCPLAEGAPCWTRWPAVCSPSIQLGKTCPSLLLKPSS